MECGPFRGPASIAETITALFWHGERQSYRIVNIARPPTAFETYTRTLVPNPTRRRDERLGANT